MPFLRDLIYFVISYIMVIGIGFFLLNFLTNGFVFQFIRVKASRGKNVLVIINAVTDIYYRPGRFKGSQLHFKTRGKEKKSILVTKAGVRPMLGVFTVEVDDETNAVVTRDFSVVEGHDAVKTDSLLNRALMQPQVLDKRIQIIFIGLVIVILGLAFVGYKVNTIEQLVLNLGKLSGVI